MLFGADGEGDHARREAGRKGEGLGAEAGRQEAVSGWEQQWQGWLAGIRADALAAGVSEEVRREIQ